MTLQIGKTNFRPTALFDVRERLLQLAPINQIEPNKVWEYSAGLPQLIKNDAGLNEVADCDAFREFQRVLEDFAGAMALSREIEDLDEKQRIESDIRSYALQIPPLMRLLLIEFQQEVQRLPICLVSPRQISHELWQDVRRLFEPDHQAYDLLPEHIRRDFQEAAWCYLFDQLTACAVMSMRAAEACLRSYLEMVAPNQVSERDGWAMIFDKLEKLELDPRIDERLYDKLQNGNRMRNRYAHPGARAEISDSNEAVDVFNTAKMIAIYSYKDLARRGANPQQQQPNVPH